MPNHLSIFLDSSYFLNQPISIIFVFYHEVHGLLARFLLVARVFLLLWLHGFSLTLPTLCFSICLKFPPCPSLHYNRLKADSLLTKGIHSIQTGISHQSRQYVRSRRWGEEPQHSILGFHCHHELMTTAVSCIGSTQDCPCQQSWKGQGLTRPSC